MVFTFFKNKRKVETQSPEQVEAPPAYTASTGAAQQLQSNNGSKDEMTCQTDEDGINQKMDRLREEAKQLRENDEEDIWSRDEARLKWTEAKYKRMASSTRSNRDLEDEAYIRYQTLLIAEDKKKLRLRRIELDLKALQKQTQ